MAAHTGRGFPACPYNNSRKWRTLFFQGPPGSNRPLRGSQPCWLNYRQDTSSDCRDGMVNKVVWLLFLPRGILLNSTLGNSLLSLESTLNLEIKFLLSSGGCQKKERQGLPKVWGLMVWATYTYRHILLMLMRTSYLYTADRLFHSPPRQHYKFKSEFLYEQDKKRETQMETLL